MTNTQTETDTETADRQLPAPPQGAGSSVFQLRGRPAVASVYLGVLDPPRVPACQRRVDNLARLAGRGER